MSQSPAINLPSYTAFREEALRLGFHDIGVLTLPDLAVAGERLQNWLAEGFHGEMQWMVTHLDKRLDPLSLMPGTRSIVCVAMNYYPGPLPNGPETLKIARYAQGDDYHDIVKQRLKALLAWLQSHDSRIGGRALTDSAPILEKALAVKAGLGWQGKHSNLITRQIGSWVFLGELLLDVVFPDAPQPEPMADLCGRCRRCIDACPTEAIVDPAVVDANKCISYWTIESKAEAIPDDIAQQLNGWIFGCDICQEVCPWNIKFQQPTGEVAFRSRPWNLAPQANDLLALDAARFRVRYRKNPIKRTKLSGLQRNVRAAVARLRKPTAPTD